VGQDVGDVVDLGRLEDHLLAHAVHWVVERVVVVGVVHGVEVRGQVEHPVRLRRQHDVIRSQ